MPREKLLCDKSALTSKHHAQNLIQLLLEHLLLIDDHPQCEQQHEKAMAEVAEHDRKEEWKGHHRKDCGVGLTIPVHANQVARGQCSCI